MPTPIDATVGGPASNSYITLAEGDAYADDVLGTVTWVGATVDDQTRALLNATAKLDQLEWIGARATTTQALAWPRTGAECGEKIYDDATLPEEMKRGTFMLAETLLSDPTAFQTGTANNGELIPGIPNADVSRINLGNEALEVEWKDSRGSASTKNALNVQPSLVDLFGCLCLSSLATAYKTLRLVRG